MRGGRKRGGHAETLVEGKSAWSERKMQGKYGKDESAHRLENNKRSNRLNRKMHRPCSLLIFQTL